ncbi:phage tail tape measure protein [bacterium CPR1]|nr:phage tail tape measure protein [bacterium CPR1]
MDFQIKLDITPTLDAGKINAILSALKTALGPLGNQIQLIDEKQLGATLAQIKGTGDELDNVGKKAKNTQEQTDRLANAFFKFNQIREGLQTLTDTLDGLSKPFVALDTATAQLRTLGAEAAAMAPSLREAAIVMSEELPFAAAELQQTMFDALASGVQGGEEGLKKFADTAAKLAVGGGSSIGEATNLLAGQLNAYGKSAEEAGKFSDIFFNTVNFGVTSIGELSGQLSNVVPTAASLGIEIEGVGAALAQMTQKGVPTAQSTTKLNQLMLELAKPASSLAPILQKAGVSLESLKQDDLPVTLAKVKSALEAAGKASVQAFSSSEAAAAFNVLTGDLQGFQKTFEDVRDTTGSAENAYLQMSDSIDTQNRRIQASFEAALIRGFDALGGGITGVISASSSLAPTITTLIGLKQIFPAGMAKQAGQFALTLLSKVVPSLVAQTAATGGAATSQLALNTAMLANPVFLGIAGLVAAAAIAYAAFGNSTKDLGDATTDANEALAEFQKSSAQADAVAKQGEKVTELAQKYDALKNTTTTKGQEEFKKVTEDLAKAVPDAVVAIDQFNEAGVKTGTTYEVNTQQLREFVAEQNRIAQEQKNEALANLDDQTKALADSYTEALEKQRELRDDRQELQAAVDQGLGDAGTLETFGNPFETMKDDLKDVNVELAEQQKKIQEARPAIEKQIAGYREMGLSVEQIAQRTGFTTAQVIEFGGEIKGSAANAKELEAAIAGMSQTQQQAIRLVADQANGYQAAQAKVDELNAKIASQKAVGADTSQLEKDLAEAEKVAGEKKLKLEATIQAQGGDKIFEGLDENAKKGLSGLNKAVDESIAEIEAKAAQSKLGDALSQAATIKADLDANDRIGALVEKLQSAKTQAEKDSIAATIAAQVPSAISGYDELTGAVQVSEEKVKEFVAAQRESFGSDIEQKRAAFEDGLRSQAKTLEENRDRMGELQQAIVDGTSKGKDVSALRAEYATLQKTVDTGTEAVARTVKEGQRVGLIKGDVKNLGTEFKLSASQANTITTAVRQTEQATKDAKVAAGDLAAQFDAAAKAANEAKESSKKQLAQLIIERKQGKISEEEYKQKSGAIITTGRAAVQTVKQHGAAMEQSGNILGDVTRTAQSSSTEVAKNLFDVRSKELEYDEQTTLNLHEQVRIRAGRNADDRDSLFTEQEKLRTVIQQVRQYATLFKIKDVDQVTPIDELIGDPTKLDAMVTTLQAVENSLSQLSSEKVKPIGVDIALKNPEEQGALGDLTASLKNSIIEAQNSVGAWTIKVVPEMDLNALRDLERDQLRADVTVGIKTEEELSSFLKKDLENSKEALERVRAEEIEGVKKAYAGQADLEQRLAQVKQGNTVKQAKILRAIFELEQTLAEEIRKKKQEEFDTAEQKERQRFERAQQRSKELSDQFTTFTTEALKGRVEAEVAASLKGLEERHKGELISEEEFERQKEELQKNAEDRKLMIQAAGIGARRSAERLAEIESLEFQRKAIEQRQAMLLSLGVSKESKPFKDLQDELDGLTTELEEKKDVVGTLTGEIGNTIIEVFSGLLNGQEDAIKKPFRQLFGVIVGALQKLASAKIVEIILNSFGPGGIPGILVTLGGKPFIENVVNALLSPVTAALLSFPTGGRVDEPTIALIGDASRSRPGPNTEWVLRDGDIKDIINATVRSLAAKQQDSGRTLGPGNGAKPEGESNTAMVKLMAEMVREMRSFSGRIHVLERDVGQASVRYNAQVQSRILNP